MATTPQSYFNAPALVTIGPGWITSDTTGYRPRTSGGPASAPTADPTKPAGGKSLNDGSGVQSGPPGGTFGTTPAQAPTPAAPADPLTMLGQLYSQGFGNTGGGGAGQGTVQAVPVPVSSGTSPNWGALIVVALIAGAAFYWWKHHKKGAAA